MRKITFIIISLAMFHTANAVGMINVTSSAPNVFDAGVMQQNIQTSTVKHLPKILPAMNASTQPDEPIKGGNKIHFKFKKVIITGSTTYSNHNLQTIFSPYLNKDITISKIKNLIQKITVKYRTDGYILSYAILPAQEIKNGVLRVEIVEGFISRFFITGNPGRVKNLITEHAQRIIQSKPLKLSVLEHELLLINDIPGISIKSVITPSKKIVDAADLTLVVNRHVASGYLSYDNYSTRFVGPLETSVGGALNSLFFPGDTTAVHLATTSKESEMVYGDISNTQLLGSKGLNLTVGGNYTQTQPLFSLAPLDVIGRSTSIYFNTMYPIIRSRSHNLQIHSVVNYQNVTSTILDTPFYQDRFRTLSFGTAYNGNDSWSGLNTAGIDLEHGFNILGANEHYLQSRPNGQSNYTKINVSASRIQPIYRHFSFYISSMGQYAFEPLLATSQFSFGGPTYGRGYGPSEILADRGIAGKVELRAETLPELSFLQTIEYYIFYDAGVVWNIDTVNLSDRQDATSTGIGMRVNFMPQLYGEAYIAKPLSKQNTTLTPPNQNPQQTRAFFQLVARF